MADVQIPREAVDAAARSLVDGGTLTNRKWVDLSPSLRHMWCQRAEAALNAAASHVVAADLERFADELTPRVAGMHGIDGNRWRGDGLDEGISALRARAAELRGKS